MSSSHIARAARASFVGLALLGAAACNDPAKDKTKAVTTEAKESSLTSGATTGAKQYVFDQNGSKVEWTGSKITAKHEGGFKTFNGTVNVVDGKPEASAVNIDIETSSLYTTPDQLVGHLKSPDFFDVAKFPKATFASTSIKPGGEKGATHTITGNLTLHGVTKSVSFPATIKSSDTGVDTEAEFAINRKDFGLVYAGKPDDLIRDDVVIKLSVHAKNKT